MIRWMIPLGTGQKNTVTCKTTGGTPVVFTGSETLACTYWQGADAAAGGTLTTSFNTPAGGSVDVVVPATLTTSLGVGVWQWLLECTSDPTNPPLARGMFEITAGPGATTFTTAPYCQYDDVLDEAAWVKIIPNLEVDVAGFLSKRIRARNAFDWVVTRSWRGTSQAYFGDAGRSAQFWMGGWVRRSPIPSQWLQDMLTGTNHNNSNPSNRQCLIVRPWVVKANVYYTLSLICRGQIGINDTIAARERYYRDRYEEAISGEVAELDLAGTGQASLGIPLGSTNTLFT